MTERNVWLPLKGESDPPWFVDVERQRAIPWCVVHQSAGFDDWPDSELCHLGNSYDGRHGECDIRDDKVWKVTE